MWSCKFVYWEIFSSSKAPHQQLTHGVCRGDLIATGSNDKTVKLMNFNPSTATLEGLRTLGILWTDCDLWQSDNVWQCVTMCDNLTMWQTRKCNIFVGAESDLTMHDGTVRDCTFVEVGISFSFSELLHFSRVGSKFFFLNILNLGRKWRRPSFDIRWSWRL